MLIDAFDERYILGFTQMDATHRVFADIVNGLGTADRSTFPALFTELLTHTEVHFAAELALMHESSFPAIQEHTAEHQRVLSEMRYFARKVSGGSVTLGRAYIRQQLPGWFDLHAITMDSALAAHLQRIAKLRQGSRAELRE
ncbi:MAG: hemerythrin domain-containing protein [Sedimenticolaceae bacterium]